LPNSFYKLTTIESVSPAQRRAGHDCDTLRLAPKAKLKNLKTWVSSPFLIIWQS
jgi:hypothetical protein